MTEAQVQAEILRVLGARADVRLWRSGVAKGAQLQDGRKANFGFTGLADLSGVLTVHGLGFALFIEVKGPKGRLRKEQRAFLDTMTKMGACAFMARSVSEAEDYIDGFIGRIGA